MLFNSIFVLALGFLPSLALAVDYTPIDIQVLRVTTPTPGEVKFESGIGDTFRPLGSETGVYNLASLNDYIARVRKGELRYPGKLAKPIRYGMRVGGYCAAVLIAGVGVNSLHQLPQWLDNIAYVLSVPTIFSVVYSQRRDTARSLQRSRIIPLDDTLRGQVQLRAADLDDRIEQLKVVLRDYQIFVNREPEEYK